MVCAQDPGCAVPGVEVPDVEAPVGGFHPWHNSLEPCCRRLSYHTMVVLSLGNS